MKVIQYLDRDDYTLEHAGDDSEFSVWSVLLDRYFTARTLSRARQLRDEAERVKREHQRKGGE